MDRTDRSYALVDELRAVAPQWRSATWLAARFEVSRRTIERDLSALQRAGVVTPSGATDLTDDDTPAAGSSIVRAASLDEAQQLLVGRPIVDSCRIHGTVPV